MKRIRTLAGKPTGIENWGLILYSDIGSPLPPGRQLQNEEILWEAGQKCSINSDTPWNIIKHALIWYTWCQHCEHDLQDGIFHIGIALYKSWQVTVQVGMSVWTELQRFRSKRSLKKHSEMERILLDIWCQGGLFCSNDGGKPQWKPAPHLSYLTQDYSNRYASTRIHRQDNPAQNMGYQSPPHSNSLPDSNPLRPPSPGQWAMSLLR
jgi:hypothetical protein